jgi:hypothetical protein
MTGFGAGFATRGGCAPAKMRVLAQPGFAGLSRETETQRPNLLLYEFDGRNGPFSLMTFDRQP